MLLQASASCKPPPPSPCTRRKAYAELGEREQMAVNLAAASAEGEKVHAWEHVHRGGSLVLFAACCLLVHDVQPCSMRAGSFWGRTRTKRAWLHSAEAWPLHVLPSYPCSHS